MALPRGSGSASFFTSCRVVPSAVPGRYGMHGVSNMGELMADRIIVYWRDIPAQVIVKQGRKTAKRELSLRFTEAIDMCAMRSGAAGTEDYLAEWRKAEPTTVSDDLEAEADKAAGELEAAYGRDRLVTLVKAGGRETA